jgi:hypothetical protein
MEITTAQTTGRGNHIQEKQIFSVVIAYEDFSAGKHAKQTYDCLVRHLGGDFEFENQMWKFDVLENAKLNEMAAKDASTADLIIVSTHGVGDLPREVKQWIDQWMRHTSAMALVTLVDRPPHGRHREEDIVRPYLERVARKARMDFFAQPDEWPDREDDYSLQQFSDRAQRTSTLMATFIHQHASAPRWGIAQ